MEGENPMAKKLKKGKKIAGKKSLRAWPSKYN
jgi:hypothetical protein